MTSFTIPTIETERLILRAPHLDDLPAMTAFFATERSHMVGGPKDAFECWSSSVEPAGSLGAAGLWPVAPDRKGQQHIRRLGRNDLRAGLGRTGTGLDPDGRSRRKGAGL